VSPGPTAATGAPSPLTLSVIWGALRSIAVETGTTVHRTAYSEQAREGQDLSVAVFDPHGRMVAQGPYSPGHMRAMSFAVRNALAAHPLDTLRPGQAILLNDRLLGAGHFPDFFITQPAFLDDRVANAIDRVVADPQVRHRGMVASVPHPELGPRPTLGAPAKVDGALGVPMRAAPGLGEHTDEVLAALAGCGPEGLEDLRARKVIA